jgi:beta-xylosidase
VGGPPPPSGARPGAARRRLLQIVAAAVAVLVIAGAAVYVIRRITADEGVQAASPGIGTSSAPAAPACGFTDDFGGATLDAGWERTRTDADATLADGALTLQAPEGSDIYEDKIGAPMVLRSQTGDFQAETELTATPHQFYQGAGLVLWSSSKTYVRLELGWGDVRAIAYEYRNGGKHIKLHPPFKAGPNPVRTNADRVILQLRRAGDTVDARWRRPDETAYTDLGTIDVNLPDTVKVGLSVLNRAQSRNRPEDFSARFEKASLSC